jgi:hypothetical protein
MVGGRQTAAVAVVAGDGDHLPPAHGHPGSGRAVGARLEEDLRAGDDLGPLVVADHLALVVDQARLVQHGRVVDRPVRAVAFERLDVGDVWQQPQRQRFS